VSAEGQGTARRLILPLLLLLSLTLNLWGNSWGLPNDKSWSNDDPTPDTALSIPTIWAEDWHKYPYLLPWLDRALYAPQLATWRRDGSLSSSADCRIPSDDDCFTDIHAQWGRLMAISRVARAVMGTGVVLAVFLIASFIAGGPFATSAGLLAAAVAAFSQVLVFYAHVGNVDVAMTFFFAWSLVAWLRALGMGAQDESVQSDDGPRNGGPRAAGPLPAANRHILNRHSGNLQAHAAFGALGGAALACKEAIYGAYVLPGAALVALAAWRAWRRWRGSISGHARDPRSAGQAHPVAPESTSPAPPLVPSPPTDRWRPLAIAIPFAGPLLAGLALLVVYGFANNVLGNPSGFRAHVSYWTSGTGIAPWNDGFTGHATLLWTFVRRMAEGMSWPLLLLAIVGAALAWRRPRARWLLLPTASYYLFTIAAVRFAYTRFTLPVVVLLAAAAGVGLSAAWRDSTQRGWRPALLLLYTLGLGHGLIYSLHGNLLLRADARYSAEAWLRANVPLDANIDSFGSRTHLPRLDWLGYDSDRIDEDEFSAAHFQTDDDDRPAWLVLSEKTVGGLEGEQAALRDSLLAGEAGYELVLDAHGRSGLEPWLIRAWTESRINPRIWILRRQDDG